MAGRSKTAETPPPPPRAGTNVQVSSREETALEKKYDLLRKKKALKRARQMVRDAEKAAKRETAAKESEATTKREKAKRPEEVDVDGAFEDATKGGKTFDVETTTTNAEADPTTMSRSVDAFCDAKRQQSGGDETTRCDGKSTTRAMKRPGRMKKTEETTTNTTVARRKDDGEEEDEDNETLDEKKTKTTTTKRSVETPTAKKEENKDDAVNDDENTNANTNEKKKKTEEEERGRKEDVRTTKESGGAMKITFKKKAPAAAAKAVDASKGASGAAEKKEEAKKEEEDPVAKAIAKAKLVMQKENERREREEKEAELKKKLKEEEEAKRKEEEERANAVPKVIVPKFGKKRELDPEWLKAENERYEREQKEREERERIEKEEALKPKKRQQKRPKMAPKKLLPPVPEIVPGVGDAKRGNLDTEPSVTVGEGANGDVEAGQMAVLDDETAKAVGVGQKILEEDQEADEHRRDLGTEVFVGGIPPEATEGDVGDAFSRFGKVSKVRLFEMQSYGFVKFYGVKSAAAAVKHYEGYDGSGNTPLEDPVLICDTPVNIVEFSASGKDVVVQKAKEIAMKKREGETVEEEEAAAKAREVMTYEEI